MWILVFDLAAGWAPNRVSVFSQAAVVRPIIMLLRCDSELGAFSKLAQTQWGNWPVPGFLGLDGGRDTGSLATRRKFATRTSCCAVRHAANDGEVEDGEALDEGVGPEGVTLRALSMVSKESCR